MAGPMDANACGEELARSLSAQVVICEKILDLSRQQKKMVEERREDELLSLLDTKQRLIDQHQGLSRKSQPFREQWERERGLAALDVHAKVEAAWNSLKTVLDNIVQLEDVSRALLQDHKGQVSIDIGRLQKGKIVNKAYGGGTRPPPQARFSDRQG